MGGGGADVDVLSVLIGRRGDHADAGGEVTDDAPDVLVGDDVLGDDGGFVGVGLVVVFNDFDGVGLVADGDAALFLIPLGGHQLGGVGEANAILGVVAGHGGRDGDLDAAFSESAAAQHQGKSQDDCKNLLHTVRAPFLIYSKAEAMLRCPKIDCTDWYYHDGRNESRT